MSKTKTIIIKTIQSCLENATYIFSEYVKPLKLFIFE